VAVVGEGGIGKTSLLSAFAADALATQARVLLGRCYESTWILPFGLGRRCADRQYPRGRSPPRDARSDLAR
jgi:GTPase SAR1 family protein